MMLLEKTTEGGQYMLEPLKKTRLYEEIVKQMIDLIEGGSLKPGDKLPPERQLAEELNVSRTAIREALRSLESMGYIESKVGGGTFIREISLDNALIPFSSVLSQDKNLIKELLEVRQLLESEIALLASKRASAEDIERMEAALDLMRQEVDSGEIGLRGDNAFHNALALASQNMAMSKILGLCDELLSRSRESTLRIPGQPAKSLEDHVSIYHAIKDKDHVLAQQLMKQHMIKAQENYRDQYLQ
jgi:GntR family transcriptional repressor for pyruvate dehydrogenase complex